MTKFRLSVSDELVGSGVRREFQELGQEPKYWDEESTVPYVSPILRKIALFYPNLVELELDFLTENFCYGLRGYATIYFKILQYVTPSMVAECEVCLREGQSREDQACERSILSSYTT